MTRTARIALVLWAASCVPVFGKQTPDGVAMIRGTAEGSPIAGSAQFVEHPDGVEIAVTISNAPPGLHGLHIHEQGSCADEGKAAGGHYNPAGAPHGLVTRDGFTHAHAGDLGNIKIGADGNGVLHATVSGLHLTQGQYTVAGRTVILHEKPDDFGQPTGNAGSRIGCGVITVAGQ